MTVPQTKRYFWAWGQVREILIRQGVPKKEVDARRHQIHVEVFGAQKSSKDFSSADLDKVLARFGELTGTDLRGQMDAITRPAKSARARKLWVLDKLLRDLGRSREYAQGIARKMGLSTADFDTLPDEEFRNVLAALNKQVGRTPKEQPKEERSTLNSQRSTSNVASSADDGEPDWDV